MRHAKTWGAMLCMVSSALLAAPPLARNVMVHEVAFDGCHFKIYDPYQGRMTGASYFSIISPKSRHPFGTWIQFFCKKQDIDKNFLAMGIKRAGSNWTLATEQYTPLPEENTSVYELHNARWIGAAIASNDTTGEFERRRRGLGFCIASTRQMLCGNIEQVMFVAYPEESVLPEVIQLLESIEFIDTPSSAPASSGTTTAPHP